MKICMIGLGSIGCRHLKNICKVLDERKILYNVDAFRSNNRMLNDEIKGLIKKEFYNLNDLPNDYDIIFITNPTNMHHETIKKVICKTKHIFIEKPIFNHCDYNINDIPWKDNAVYYIACPLRYNPVIKYIKKMIFNEHIYSVRVISSSYLPDWREGIDYRNIYSASKEKGGGVTLDLIHEWDYITYLFGMPKEVYNINGKYSHLEINSDDISIYIARYEKLLVEIHLDYFGRYARRQLELLCKDYVILLDLINMTIEYKGSSKELIQLQKEDIYINEINYFLDIVETKELNHNDIKNAYELLNVILK